MSITNQLSHFKSAIRYFKSTSNMIYMIGLFGVTSWMIPKNPISNQPSEKQKHDTKQLLKIELLIWNNPMANLVQTGSSYP